MPSYRLELEIGDLRPGKTPNQVMEAALSSLDTHHVDAADITVIDGTASLQVVESAAELRPGDYVTAESTSGSVTTRHEGVATLDAEGCLRVDGVNISTDSDGYLPSWVSLISSQTSGEVMEDSKDLEDPARYVGVATLVDGVVRFILDDGTAWMLTLQNVDLASVRL